MAMRYNNMLIFRFSTTYELQLTKLFKILKRFTGLIIDKPTEYAVLITLHIATKNKKKNGRIVNLIEF